MYNTYIDIDISCVIVIIVIIIKVNIVRIHNNFPVLCKCIILTSHSVPECGFEGLKTYQAPAST